MARFAFAHLHFIPKNMVNGIVSQLLDVFTCLCYNSSTRPKKYLKIYKPGFITFRLCRCTQTLTLNASTKCTSRSNTRSSTTQVQTAERVDSFQQYSTHLEATKHEPRVKSLNPKKVPEHGEKDAEILG